MPFMKNSAVKKSATVEFVNRTFLISKDFERLFIGTVTRRGWFPKLLDGDSFMEFYERHSTEFEPNELC